MIGERLIESGDLTPEQLEQALESQRAAGGLLGEILVKLHLVTEEAVSRALAKQAGVPFYEARDLQPDAAAVALVPESLARRHLVAAIKVDADTLHVAQANPFDVLAIDALQRATGRHVEPSCAPRQSVLNLIERSYQSRREVPGLARSGVTTLGQGSDSYQGDAPVVRIIERLLHDAIARGATDLHIEPEERLVRLRHRIDGVLLAGETLPKPLHASLISRLKVMGGLDITEQRLPQEGRISQVIDDRQVDVRVSTFPTTHGEKVALRIMEKDKLIRGIEELGFGADGLLRFRDLLTRTRGIVLVTGPTGAGKTTTLYSALSELAQRQRNILTVEDPVEYQLPSVRQTQIRPKAGLTFATAIRSLLRQDPDVIMIGEIRDPETAQLALRASLSGILVFSTLHTSDSPGAIPRLMDMGLEPYLLASAISGVVAQRLVRAICPECIEPVTYSDEMLRKLGITAPVPVFYRGRGCPHCNETGYRGPHRRFRDSARRRCDQQPDSRSRRLAANQGSGGRARAAHDPRSRRRTRGRGRDDAGRGLAGLVRVSHARVHLHRRRRLWP
ncbi:MAG: ATPase, T2SS/T4P/T4SS family [Vicinamibacterales bacterium]